MEVTHAIAESSERGGDRIDLNLKEGVRPVVVGIEHIVRPVDTYVDTLAYGLVGKTLQDIQQVTGELIDSPHLREVLLNELAVSGHPVDQFVEDRLDRLSVLELRAAECVGDEGDRGVGVVVVAVRVEQLVESAPGQGLRHDPVLIEVGADYRSRGSNKTRGLGDARS